MLKYNNLLFVLLQPSINAWKIREKNYKSCIVRYTWKYANNDLDHFQKEWRPYQELPYINRKHNSYNLTIRCANLGKMSQSEPTNKQVI